MPAAMIFEKALDANGDVGLLLRTQSEPVALLVIAARVLEGLRRSNPEKLNASICFQFGRRIGDCRCIQAKAMSHKFPTCLFVI
jgi:hypothetical protein